MATTAQAAMEGIERRRAQLEENVSKLRAALRHWQTLEMEYSMFKEEIEFADSPSPSEMLDIGRSLKCSLVDDKEVQELVGSDKANRSANQVADIISRRIDYVQQNITGAAKRLDDAEKKLAGTEVFLGAEEEDEEGLPLMDIQEELDEEGNVVSGSVVEPGKAAPQIVEALRKAGIGKIGQEDGGSVMDVDEAEAQKSASATSTSPTNGKQQSQPTEEGDKPLLKEEPKPSGPGEQKDLPARPKKSVTFSEDTKSEPILHGKAALEESGYNEDLADYNFTKGTKVIEVDENDTEIASYPIIPQGESPEDAELRRQMLQYGLSEVGQVVAEMDLDDPNQDYSDDDFDAYDDDVDFESEMSEVEDEHGRSLRREVPDEYRQKMMELEKKLNAQMIENIGPRPEGTLAEYSNDIRTLKIRKDDDFKSEDKTEDMQEDVQADPSEKKKGVRFAEELDISPAPKPTAEPVPVQQPRSAPTSTTTISDTIVERSGPAPQAPRAPSKPAKVSRFKSARAASTPGTPNQLPPPAAPHIPPVPTGPAGRTLASTIVEHDISNDQPHIPDEFDPVVVNREIQVQYHKLRNKLIQQQGGFKPSQEEEDDPLIEERDGKERKVSRFRSARLKSEGGL